MGESFLGTKNSLLEAVKKGINRIVFFPRGEAGEKKNHRRQRRFPRHMRWIPWMCKGSYDVQGCWSPSESGEQVIPYDDHLRSSSTGGGDSKKVGQWDVGTDVGFGNA